LIKNFGLILANTSRSRAYLAALEKNLLLPSSVILLDVESPSIKPGQVNLDSHIVTLKDSNWPEINFDVSETITNMLDRLNLNYEVANTNDVNDDKVILLLKRSNLRMYIYSGYGGVLVSNRILSLGIKFLHVHGGFLPDFKGSTTNYYSILKEGFIGASSFYLTSEIDSGQILVRRKFDTPFNKLEMDHFYDSAARARVLVETLKLILSDRLKIIDTPQNTKNQIYYVIHPVLKAIAIFGK